MFAWLNVGSILISAVLFLIFYNLSVSPAQLEQKMGAGAAGAYEKCGRYRVVAMIFMLIAAINYVIYYFYPLPISLPQTFAWGWPISIVIGVVIAIPSFWVMARGLIDAGPEAVAPKKEHTMYGGIYEKIRHPQALGEMWTYHIIGFLLNSPFLVLLSFIWLPIFYWICVAEEKDLVVRYGRSFIEYQQRTGFLWPR